MSKKSVDQKSKGKIAPIIGLLIVGVVVLWIVFTVITPISRGDGVNKYSGVQKGMASTIVDLTRLYYGPKSPTLPHELFNVRVEDIHSVTPEEISDYCKDPAYITNDPSNPRYYTVVVSEQYLLTPIKKTTNYIGCNPTDYIYAQVFGYPEGLDPRVKLPVSSP